MGEQLPIFLEQASWPGAVMRDATEFHLAVYSTIQWDTLTFSQASGTGQFTPAGERRPYPDRIAGCGVVRKFENTPPRDRTGMAPLGFFESQRIWKGEDR